MKKITIVLIVAVGCAYYYNSIWFRSMFDSSFYESIVEVPFDVLEKGERIAVPLTYEYKTCYAVGVAVPGRELANSRKTGAGRLSYKFISDGKILASGVTHPVVGHGWSGDDHNSIRPLMVFDLPFPGASQELMLSLEVVEPFSFMEGYKGRTLIVIRPNYEPKVGKCYDEDLRIQY
ncbi:hypothetical protein [Desulfovibrio sp. Huiquan2017]|uniref:hypothetical protein n=1 Tax=Desulfovibrio sp. Huiquan2017 TaxID=2816861 RepID=UPI001A917A40|nr:hypothetical protein [Desulfovibrio sp. Huiquan2017]